eukprot:maker-scaffold397_size184017-snap-gene-0.45 protein:Tk01046 transcript:maker-scaffold397_size184017-snap-gene-0.45-mRNA-1 annotation:"sodium:proton antiporter"
MRLYFLVLLWANTPTLGMLSEDSLYWMGDDDEYRWPQVSHVQFNYDFEAIEVVEEVQDPVDEPQELQMMTKHEEPLPKCSVLPQCQPFKMAFRQLAPKSLRLEQSCELISDQLKAWAPKFFNKTCTDPYQPKSEVLMPSYMMLAAALESNLGYHELIRSCEKTRQYFFHYITKLNQNQVKAILGTCQSQANTISWVVLVMGGMGVVLLVMGVLLTLMICPFGRRPKQAIIGYSVTREVRMPISQPLSGDFELGLDSKRPSGFPYH